MISSLINNLRNISDRYFIFSADFAKIFEDFFVSAIASILGIRLFLEITNYPQLGGGKLHIAHMLWGGALMLISIILLLTFLSRSTRRFSAILAGIGFGTFIDELGKFITRDNNYFYQPAFSIIYIIFIFLYLIFYEFEKHQNFSPKEYLINSLDLMKEAVIKDLDSDEKKQAMEYLKHCDHRSPITRTILELYQKLDTIPPSNPGIIARLKISLRNFYLSLVKKSWFSMALNIFFILQFLVSTFLVLTSAVVVITVLFSNEVSPKDLSDNIIDLLDLIANTVAGFFIILGVLKMRRSRLQAYQMFKKGVLVSIFLVQVFSFYSEQLNAFIGLLFNVLILFTINYMIDQEQTIHTETNNQETPTTQTIGALS